jgi:hypothetical protein
MLRAVLMLIVATLLAAGCGGRPDAAPATKTVRQPVIVGVVRSWGLYGNSEGRYTLDTGDVVDLNVNGGPDLPETPVLSETHIYFPDGGESYGEPIGRRSVLLLVGHDPDGTVWYAAANQRDDEKCPFEIRGAGVYDEGDVLHFSTGLVLPKASRFALFIDYHDIDEFPLRSADTICIDRSGTAVSARIWLPY